MAHTMEVPEYRNAKCIWDDLIDCEINHPDFGWIPFTCQNGDTFPPFDNAELYRRMKDDPATIPWDGSPAPAVIPLQISRRQCALQLLTLQMITSQEAISMTQTGAPPAAIMSYIDTLQEPQKTGAIIDFAATTYDRTNPLLIALMQANNMTDKQVDDFFIAASQL